MKNLVLALALLSLFPVSQSFGNISEDMLVPDNAAQAKSIGSKQAKKEFIAALKDAETSFDTYRAQHDAIIHGEESPTWLVSALESVINSKANPYAKNYAKDLLNVLSGTKCSALSPGEFPKRKNNPHFMEPSRKGNRQTTTAHYMGNGGRGERTVDGPHYGTGNDSF